MSWDWLGDLGDYAVYPRTAPEEVVVRSADADAVLTNKVVFGEKEMAALPRLRYIGVQATGYNVVDIAAATARGIVVTNIPSYSTDSVAQSVFAHILNIVNDVGHYATLNVQGVCPSRWAECTDFCYYDTPLTELVGKAMGIVGFGRIGSRVAAIALAFGMKVLVYTSKPQEAMPAGVTKCDLDELFRRSDVISLHCPLTPETHHLVDAPRLALMKPTAILINTSRGPVVDEEALADALCKGALWAAGVDVVDHEPPSTDCPLLKAPNCYITPHIAWATREARTRLMQICRQNLVAFVEGAPINVVNH